MCDVLFVTPNLSTDIHYEINGSLLLGTILLAEDFSVEVLRYIDADGYDSDYHEFIRNITEKILKIEPRSISFYTIWTNYHIVLRICEEVKKRNNQIQLILGGPQASVLARETMERFCCVDYVCAGEGENTVVPFFSRLLRSEGPEFSEIPGLYYREGNTIVFHNHPVPRTDLENLPYWDDRLLADTNVGDKEHRGDRRECMPVEVGRGCPYNCTFCSTCAFWNRHYRLKSTDRIIEDIEYYHKKYGFDGFLLSHDALTAQKRAISELCDKLMALDWDIRWECSTRVDCLPSELLQKMKDSGLMRIHMGIETGSERMQKLTHKNLNLTEAKQTVKKLLDMKIDLVIFFVFGIPEETEEDFNKTLELMFELRDLGMPTVHLITCLFSPGSDLTSRFQDQLVFDPIVQKAALSRFGCAEEIEMIKQHKPLFTTFYTYHSDVCDKYPHAKYLPVLYQKFPRTARYVRGLYGGDNLRFCRDFQDNNCELLNEDVTVVEAMLERDPLQIMLNTLKGMDAPTVQQVRELLRFEMDIMRFAKAENGTAELNTYGFYYHDYKLGCSADQLSKGTSKILMQKANDRISMRVLQVTAEK